jgi:DNA replication and repair protein RecF
MWVKALYLRNFRSYSEARFEFCPQNNLIIGPNARGKTTILEAIYLMITGRSFRTSCLGDLVKEGESGFYVELHFEKHGISQSLRFVYEGKLRRIFNNHNPCGNLSDLLGILQGSLLLPDDIQLIKGAPKLRRDYLDLQLAQMNPLYVHHLTRYYRAMRHRNILLKKHSLQAIEVFEYEMAKAGSFLIQTRQKAVEALTGDCRDVQEILSSGKEQVALKYVAKSGPDELVSQFASLRPREMKMGSTLVGPHLDDLLLMLGSREAKLFASEGQKKSLATALKFAEWKQLNAQADSPPLMLIDDVGVSLDAVRRERLFSSLAAFKQVFVTSTEPLDFSSMNRSTHLINV